MVDGECTLYVDAGKVIAVTRWPVLSDARHQRTWPFADKDRRVLGDGLASNNNSDVSDTDEIIKAKNVA